MAAVILKKGVGIAHVMGGSNIRISVLPQLLYHRPGSLGHDSLVPKFFPKAVAQIIAVVNAYMHIDITEYGIEDGEEDMRLNNTPILETERLILRRRP